MKKIAFIVGIIATCLAVIYFFLNWFVSTREDKEKRTNQTAAAREARINNLTQPVKKDSDEEETKEE